MLPQLLFRRVIGICMMSVFVATRITGFRPLIRTNFWPRGLALHSKNHPSLEDAVGGLLGSALRRAQTTISVSQEFQAPKNDEESPTLEKEEAVDGMLQSKTVTQAQRTIIDNKNQQQQSQQIESNKASNSAASSLPPARPYRGNPTITNTALAHSLWSTILRPSIDSAIDATCGNGYDSVALAKMLFSGRHREEDCNSQLLCVDIQKQACDNTTAALAQEFFEDPQVFEKQMIQVLHTSHAALPRPNDSSSVGLVVYNLGWLPNSDDGKDCVTKMDSTLHSITDAMLMVRIGGMISVVTYPKSNPEEDIAVRVMLECAALLSSNVQTWREFLDSALLLGGEKDAGIKELVASSMERIEGQGDPRQTWRVAEHKRLGMDRAPILVTATRIK